MNFRTTRFRLAMLAAGMVLAAGASLSIIGCDNTPPIEVDVHLDLENMSDEELCRRLDGVIEHAYRHRRLSTRVNAAWQIIHAVIPFGQNLLIHDDEGRTVRAIDYVLNGGRMLGWTLEPGNDLGNGRHGVRAILEVGSSTGQGHKDQWLGYMAVSSELPTDRTVKVRGQDHTVEDWLKQIKLDVHEGTERGWSLMALSTYYPADDTWTAADGATWSVERAMATEAAQDFRAGACGGTHALSGMTIALLNYIIKTGATIAADGPYRGQLVSAAGQPVEGGFADATRRIDEAIRLAKEYQQADGSFSNSYFQSAAHSNDLQDRLRKTGHVLEFLGLALSDAELKQDWVRRAVIHLVDVLERTKKVDLECGALYHGMRGLTLYRKRIFDAEHGPLPYDRWAEDELKRANGEINTETRSARRHGERQPKEQI